MHETTVAVGAGAIMAVSMSVVPGSVIMTMVIMLMVSMPMVMMPMVMMPMVMMPVPVAMRAAAKHERARDIDAKPECCDRNRLDILDRHRRQEAQHRLVTDQERDHHQHDSAGESRKVAELAGPEAETCIFGMPARVAVGDGGEPERSRVREHVQAIGNERDRAEQQFADDLGHHHDAAERDDAPGPALVAHMARAEEDMAVSEGGSLVARAHAGLITLRRMCISCGLAPAASARRSSSGIAADGACSGRIET